MFTDVQQADLEVSHDPSLSACQCAGCLGVEVLQPDTVSVDASLDPLAGGTSNNKPIWTPEQIAAHFNRTGGGFADGFKDTTNVGRQNNIGDDNSVITFGFFNTQAQVINNGYTYTANNVAGVPTLFGLSEVFNFAAFTTAQRDATREAMQGWDDVVAVTFREASADDADMNFGNLASAPTTQAYARIPTAGLDATLGGQVREIGGDSWISASQASNFQLDEGGYGLQTLSHEIGHSIGLSHPGGYNAAPGLSITYAANAEYAQDTRAYSIMSYFNASSLGGRHFDFNISTTAYAGAPLIHDILAAQRIYGADMTTRTGDTVYGFNSNAGRDQFDFTKTPAPISAIWDAGGIDTIDASGYATVQLIDLTAGSLSSIGGVTFETAPSFEQVNANRAAAGFGSVARATYDANMAALKANPVIGRLTDNFGIAYGVTIENAIGGSGNDTIIGNAVDNVLIGNGGADVLTGKGGNDTLLGGAGDDVLVGGIGADLLDGGDGFDTASYRDSASGVTVTISDGTISVSGDGVGDRFIGIEAVEGSAFADLMTGGDGNDTLSGLGGNDVIDGGNGLDLLDGGDGDDTLRGGNAADQLFGGAGNDILEGGNDMDTLFGGAGDDRLFGGNGDDTLNGGAGSDRLEGGRGADKFVFGDLGGIDVIVDFASGSDKIDLTLFDPSAAAGDQALVFLGNATFSSVAGQVRTYSEGGINYLAGDVNGDGIADFVIDLGSATVLSTDILL